MHGQRLLCRYLLRNMQITLIDMRLGQNMNNRLGDIVVVQM